MLDTFKENHDTLKEKIKEIVDRGISEGNIRPDVDSDAASLMIGSLLLGISAQLLIDPEMNIDALRQATIQVLQNSLSNGR